MFLMKKNIAILQIKGFHETATFISYITKLWNILNVKSPGKVFKINDENREPIRSVEDERLCYRSSMASNISSMDTSKSARESRVMQLMKDASNALHVTLNGLVDLTKILLQKRCFLYTSLAVSE